MSNAPGVTKTSFLWDSTTPVLKFTKLDVKYRQGKRKGVRLCFQFDGPGCYSWKDMCPNGVCEAAVFESPENTCCPKFNILPASNSTKDQKGAEADDDYFPPPVAPEWPNPPPSPRPPSHRPPSPRPPSPTSTTKASPPPPLNIDQTGTVKTAPGAAKTPAPAGGAPNTTAPTGAARP